METLTLQTHQFSSIQELRDFVNEITMTAGSNTNYTVLLDIRASALEVTVEIQSNDGLMCGGQFSLN